MSLPPHRCVTTTVPLLCGWFTLVHTAESEPGETRFDCLNSGAGGDEAKVEAFGSFNVKTHSCGTEKKRNISRTNCLKLLKQKLLAVIKAIRCSVSMLQARYP